MKELLEHESIIKEYRTSKGLFSSDSSDSFNLTDKTLSIEGTIRTGLFSNSIGEKTFSITDIKSISVGAIKQALILVLAMLIIGCGLLLFFLFGVQDVSLSFFGFLIIAGGIGLVVYYYKNVSHSLMIGTPGLSEKLHSLSLKGMPVNEVNQLYLDLKQIVVDNGYYRDKL